MGNSKTKSRAWLWFLIGGLVIAGAFYVGIIRPILRSPEQSVTVQKSVQPQKVSLVSAEDERMMKEMLASKLVERIDVEMNEGWIDPLAWAGLKFEGKKHLGWFLATYCGKKKGNNLSYVEIKDSYSGKTLAKYSESWRFKVY